MSYENPALSRDVQVDITERVAPGVELIFYFGNHETDADAQKFAADLALADVYVPECNMWNQHALDRYTNVSNGVETPQEARMKKILGGYGGSTGFEMAKWRMLYGTHKKIAFIDVPESMQNVIYSPEPEIDYDQDFATVLQEMRIYIHALGSNHRRREIYMKDRLRELIEAQDPTKPVKLLVTLGAGHSNLADEFTHGSAQVTHKFEDDDFNYLYETQAYMKAKAGEEIDDELLAHVWLESTLSNYYETNGDSAALVTEVKEIVSQFSKDEVEAISNAKGTPKGNIARLIELMQAKGIDTSVIDRHSKNR